MYFLTSGEWNFILRISNSNKIDATSLFEFLLILVFHTLMKQNKFNCINILTYRSLYKKIETTHLGNKILKGGNFFCSSLHEQINVYCTLS